MAYDHDIYRCYRKVASWKNSIGSNGYAIERLNDAVKSESCILSRIYKDRDVKVTSEYFLGKVIRIA